MGDEEMQQPQGGLAQALPPQAPPPQQPPVGGLQRQTIPLDGRQVDPINAIMESLLTRVRPGEIRNQDVAQRDARAAHSANLGQMPGQNVGFWESFTNNMLAGAGSMQDPQAHFYQSVGNAGIQQQKLAELRRMQQLEQSKFNAQEADKDVAGTDTMLGKVASLKQALATGAPKPSDIQNAINESRIRANQAMVPAKYATSPAGEQRYRIEKFNEAIEGHAKRFELMGFPQDAAALRSMAERAAPDEEGTQQVGMMAPTADVSTPDLTKSFLKDVSLRMKKLLEDPSATVPGSEAYSELQQMAALREEVRKKGAAAIPAQAAPAAQQAAKAVQPISVGGQQAAPQPSASPFASFFVAEAKPATRAMSAEQQAANAMQRDAWKKATEDVSKTASAIATKSETLAGMRQQLEEAHRTGKGVDTGAFAGPMQAAREVGEYMGLLSKEAADQLAKQQKYSNSAIVLATNEQLLQRGTQTDRDFKNYLKANPDLQKSVLGNYLSSAWLKGMADKEAYKAEARAEFARTGSHDQDAFNAKWAKFYSDIPALYMSVGKDGKYVAQSGVDAFKDFAKKNPEATQEQILAHMRASTAKAMAAKEK